MSQFNIALLAKQGWRFINYPNSLVARVLKAKYYPNTDFNNAQLGNIPSLTWKSVWAAKGLLNNGLCWRVGKVTESRSGRIAGYQARNLKNGTIETEAKSLRLPSKILITIWRITWNDIPFANLKHKRVINSALCPRCGKGEEDSEHVFLKCPNNAFQQCRLLCCGLWIIWSSQYKLVHERSLESDVSLRATKNILFPDKPVIVEEDAYDH
ncbi:hypothetical protein CXB51_025741 [Gossypium anomalum]|uniref:Reverse transcriptase zinc-binding domain-containing protein n=1 Tax=Gossypium anomalum TaxID=47600 RepID=A0A8J5YAN5_9ROSI|nr:hypothetical protein CXB51_025741 [Gossypium anomalum]